MGIRGGIKYRAKWLAVRSGLDLLFRPFQRLLVFVSYLSQAIAWSRKASNPRNGRAIFRTRNELYQYINTDKVGGEPMEYLEFGVWTGGSFRWWLEGNRSVDSRFVGFDTFSGLPEDWGYYRKGHFDTSGQVPVVEDPRARFEVGLFQNTLGAFLKNHSFQSRKVINIDADLYSSTLFVLTSLAPHLESGDIIIFDEFLAWRTPADQFRAFQDFFASYYFECEFVGAACCFEKVAVEVRPRTPE